MIKKLFIFSLKEDMEAKEEKLAELIEKSMKKPKIRLSISHLPLDLWLTIDHATSGSSGKPKKSMLEKVNKARKMTERKQLKAKRKRAAKRERLYFDQLAK